MKKRHTSEQIVHKLREAEAKLAAGSSVPETARELGISEATFHRWKTRYGTMTNCCGSRSTEDWTGCSPSEEHLTSSARTMVPSSWPKPYSIGWRVLESNLST